MIIWLTGMSSAGKTTIGRALQEELVLEGRDVELLDGDAVREALGSTLGFSRKDRNEQIRRLGFIAHLLSKHGVITIVAAISPYAKARDEVRATVSASISVPFIEVFVNASLATCEQRDVKGLYKRARLGEITNFTGVSDPYEPPQNPEIVCYTDQETVEASVRKILDVIHSHSPRR